VVLEAVNGHRGDLPVSAILGIVAQETGGIAYGNSGDGVMQVTTGAGTCRGQPGPYEDTEDSIRRNVRDGICVLRDQYTRNKGNLIYAVWKYNAGENPYNTYERGEGDRYYLQNVARHLKCNEAALVWMDFGSQYCDPELADHLEKAQNLVTAGTLPQWPDSSCTRGINCRDLTKPVSTIAPEGEFKK
jgi:hypothetical protein